MRKLLGYKRRETINAYIMLAPWIIGFIVFTAGPMIASLIISFMDWPLLQSPRWIGMENYRFMFNDDLFWISLYNTIYYTLIGVPLRVIAALCVALAMNLKLKGISVYRTIYYLPSITPAVATSIMWMWIFNPDFGLANALLRYIGIESRLRWIYDPVLSKPSLIIMSLWGVGGQMIILLAGLQGIPEQLYEAADIDGANLWHKFWHITLPMLSPSIFFVTIMQVISSFQVFTQAYVMTNGGPANSTLFLVLYLYRNGFEFFKMGYASALAWALFVFVLILTIIQFRTSRSWVFYEGELRG
ncbi:MAG: sugar ABC transporter permease [Dictyoglomi bacterium]|nr:sugar ABC transporter permease [Dictyoglomota bacterium]